MGCETRLVRKKLYLVHVSWRGVRARPGGKIAVKDAMNEMVQHLRKLTKALSRKGIKANNIRIRYFDEGNETVVTAAVSIIQHA